MSVKLEYSYKGGFYVLFTADSYCILHPEDMKELSRLLKEEGF